jgi:hypothetical protein
MIMMDLLIIAIAVGLFGFIAYKFGVMRTKSKTPVKTSAGKTIVVDRTPVDTSKEDAIKDKFGDLDQNDPKRPK